MLIDCSTGASEVVEKKIEKIIEKSSTDGILKKTNPSIPRGRNDFKSIAEKWQSIESSSVSSPAPSRPQLATPPSTTPSILSKPSAPSPVKSSISDLKFPPRENTIPQTVTRTPSGLSSSSRDDSARIMQAKLEAMEADKAWAAEKCKSESEPQQQRVTSTGSGAGTKRSVSVNDIRKAFEKAEIAVNSYNGREGGSPTEEGTGKNKDGGLTLPAAHFRVSSFDSTTSEESGAPTPAGMYGSSNSLVSSAPKDPYGSITSLASSTSLISPQELQQLIDEANQSLEEAGTPSHEVSVVHKVLTSSIADRDGRIHRCDRILSINGKSTKGLTHREALNLLKSPRTEVVLVVSRGRTANGFQTISETSALDRAIEPLLNGNLVIENDDDTCYKWGSLKTATLVKDGAGLGFSLEGGKGSIQGDKPLTVKKIFIGGPAEKSGELKLGDLIVSINGINMSSKSRTEAWNFMKKLNDGDVKITIRSPLV
ncbi:Pro-interleukin-16 [Folsomia candida]|uniref:Pro-interleukin-16 n=1 Tax=Folsomia candida TaxID=158441 RepID=A0A226EZP6_FOLCA|nr:Pro-interleukin-16 [Folsomia candida]